MKQKAFLVVFTFLSLVSQMAMAGDHAKLQSLQSEMLKLISTPDRDKFTEVTEQLKAESHQYGDERLFYVAWGNQSTYEAIHQNYEKAEDILEKLTECALGQSSLWGNYVALHTKAVNALQKQDYQAAEEGFLKAVAFRHKYFPGESAGDDLQELMKIANHRKDQKAGLKYARQILAEPNVAPIHKGRALFRLSQFAFNKDNKQLFDSVYNELQALKRSDGMGTLEPVVEVNHLIIKGNYQEALRLCQDLSPESRAERMAIIYHKMGDDTKAYEYMSEFKKINDSIVLVSHGNVVSSCFVQMNNERMKLEQKMLEEENASLRHMIALVVVVAVVIIFGILLWLRHRRIKHLENENIQLAKAQQKAEKAFDLKNEFIANITDALRAPLNPIEGFSDILGAKDYELQPDEREELSQHIKNSSKHISKLIDELADLSFYESVKSLPVNYTMSPNHIGRKIVDFMRPRCKEGVRMFFESELPDDYAMAVNQEAVEKLIMHLLDNAVKYTDKGVITLAVTEYGDAVHVSVTDTGHGIAPELREHIFDTFRELGDNMRLNGLGLPVCKLIVQLLGGKIWLDSDYQEGSRFIFEIPLKHQ